MALVDRKKLANAFAVDGATPDGKDFQNLIDSYLIKSGEDGIEKNAGEPLKLNAVGADKQLIHFYEDFTKAGANPLVKLNFGPDHLGKTEVLYISGGVAFKSDNFTIIGSNTFPALKVDEGKDVLGNNLVEVNGLLVGYSGATISGKLTASKAAEIDGELNVSGAATLDSTLTVGGPATIKNSLQVAGPSTLDSLRVNQDTDLFSKLNVKGATNLTSLQVASATTLGATLDVKGATTLDSSLEVKGGLTCTGNIIFGNQRKAGGGWPGINSMAICDGFVGIGVAITNTNGVPWLPSKGVLQIGALATIPNTLIPTPYNSLLGPNNNEVAENQSFSIYAEGPVAASDFFATSDARIKRITGQSDARNDLSTLLKIRITDYTTVDERGVGTKPQKKVIGQEIQAVFPQAVSRITNVVPDIYQNAALEAGWIQLATDLKAGERVRIFTSAGPQLFEVAEVSATGFRVSGALTEEKVFVYGREVDDFHMVDYEAIAMLHVSATQELYRQLEAQREKTKLLEAAQEKLQRKFEALNVQAEA